MLPDQMPRMTFGLATCHLDRVGLGPEAMEQRPGPKISFSVMNMLVRSGCEHGHLEEGAASEHSRRVRLVGRATRLAQGTQGSLGGTAKEPVARNYLR